MDAYIRKIRKNQFKTRFQILSGTPESHKTNSVVGECNTRRQALRYAVRDGYRVIIRNKSTDFERSA